jgi:nucleoside-diphosphate-sugar epimerase
MKVLFLGGTRFTGLTLAESMAKAGHQVTVASRHISKSNAPINQIQGERSELLKCLQECSFDIVFDFIAYSDTDVFEANRAIVTERYILISTTWLPRFLGLVDAATPVSKVDLVFTESLSVITQRYLTGKALAEDAVHKLRALSNRATIVRLPVMTGTNDHTKRLHFYRSRFLDGGGLIIVDDSNHEIQVATNIDLAHVIHIWVEKCDVTSKEIWDALPPKTIIWSEFLKDLAAVDQSDATFHIVSRDRLDINMSKYLDADPLWRERAIPLSDANLFNQTGVNITPHRVWMSALETVDTSIYDDILREKELKFINNIQSESR